MKKPSDFFEVVKKGVRVPNKCLVVHYKADKRNVATPLVGFIVPKKQIKKAVERNRLKRQIRHIIAEKIEKIPLGVKIVIRVLSDAKNKTSYELEKIIDKSLEKAKEKTDKCGK